MPYKKLTAKNAKTSLNKEKDKIVLFTIIMVYKYGIEGLYKS